MKKKSFFRKNFPVISGIMAGQTPAEMIAEARECEADGAQGITSELRDLREEFCNYDSLKSVIDSVCLPFMFCYYRNSMRKTAGDEERQELLLTAADAGAAMIDVMGDLYDPSPMEITWKQDAIDRQKALIDRIHSKGCEVVISSHMQCPRTAEQVTEHLLALQHRGPDVVKIVTTVNTSEELAEAFRTTMMLHKELKVPFIHLCNGSFSRPHRFMGPVLGSSIIFAVHHYDPRYSLVQPRIRDLKNVLDSVHWNIQEYC